MTNYSKTTNFTAKDSLVSGDANKIVKGSEIDAEFDNIATASATKANIASPAFTGIVSFPDGTAGDPSITNTGDTNTGLFFSAADTLAFSAAGTAQFTMSDGAIAPVTDNDVDLGTSSLEFKDGYFDGTVHTDAINLNGTAITSTAAEINILDGVTATAAELNILDGVTSTAAELNILDGVTSTAAELNILDGVTATTAELNYNDTGSAVGTVVASKVVTVDANKDVASFRNITLTGELDAGSLDISGDADIDGTLETDALSINGTTVTSTAAELNILDGVTSTAAEVNILDGVTSTAAELNILDGKAFLDEDNMASNSATGIASQQSIKAYVDSQVTAQDLDVTDGSASIDIDLDSESLGILGGTGIDSAASGTGVTLSIDSTVATLTGSQTLTNKTLTAPTLTGTAVVASLDISGDVDVDGTLETDALSINGTAVTSTAAELNTLDGITAVVGELNALDLGSTAVGTAIASKAVILDSNKDYTGIRNFTITGELDAGSLDISGDIDVDGTTNLDAVDVDGAVDMASTLTVADDVNVDSGTLFVDVSADSVGINTTTPSSFYSTSLVVNVPDEDGITVVSPTTGLGYLMFADGTSGNARFRGYIGYEHDGDVMQFATSGVERFRIASDGSLSTATAGTSNVRFGVNAGNSITSGANSNALVGDEAGTAITTGDYNAAFGQNALASNVTGSRNTAIGRSALATLNPDTEASYNTAVGYAAGGAVTTGTNNVLMGGLSGDALTTGSTNVAVGTSALTTDTLGSRAVAVGEGALSTQNFTTATNNYNVGVGYSAGGAITTGIQNTLVGGLAGDAIGDADFNVAMGYLALSTNTVGSSSVAIGTSALQNQNPATAASMLNVAVGHDAGAAVTTGVQNTIVGALAGDALETGNNNVIIGYGSDAHQSNGANQIVIGHNITAVDNSYFSFGKASNVVSNNFALNDEWSRSSDERLKKNVQNTDLGLDFINDLRTVKYNWKASHELDSTDAELAHLYKEDPADNQMDTETSIHGFIAQEVKAALDTAGVSDFTGWSVDQYNVQQIAKTAFVIPLVKAVQELSAQVTALQAEVNTLKGG